MADQSDLYLITDIRTLHIYKIIKWRW